MNEAEAELPAVYRILSFGRHSGSKTHVQETHLINALLLGRPPRH